MSDRSGNVESMESANRGYIVAIDYLRGLSALWVVGHHILVLLPSAPLSADSNQNPVAIFFNAGWIGVTIFIMLSGFSLSLGTKQKKISWRNFAISRFLRLAPMYYFITTLSLLYGTVGLVPFLGALTFLPISDAAIFRPMMWTVWSIRIEVLTYLFFPILWSLTKSKKDITRWLTLLLFLVLLFQFSTDSAPLTLYWGLPGRLLEFSLGFYIGRTSLRYKSKFIFYLSLMSILMVNPYLIQKLGGFTSLSVNSWYLIFSLNVVSIGCVLANIEIWRLSRTLKPLQLAGRYSYSMYLIHVAVIVVFGKKLLEILVQYIGYLNAFVISSLLIYIIVFYMSKLFFDWIEYPFLKKRPVYLTD